MPRRPSYSPVSLDQALRDVVRREVDGQVETLQRAVQQASSEVSALRQLVERLAPLAQLMGGVAVPVRRGPGRPPKVAALPSPGPGKRRGRRSLNGVRAADRACAVMGCKRPSRTKGYCAAHYQKLRLLDRTKRRPSEWVEYASANSVPDIVLPRGRAAVKARQKQDS